MDTLQTQSTPEDHGVIITDVRFRPNSTQLATSSFDRSVKLWNAAEVFTVMYLLFSLELGTKFKTLCHTIVISKNIYKIL
jgi:WD40 repeat protein